MSARTACVLSALAWMFNLVVPCAASESFRNTGRDVAYVGSKVCASCHAEIYRRFQQTAMGRSMSVPSTPEHAARVPGAITIRSDKLNRWFSVFRQGDGIYQSEYETDSSGSEVFRSTQKLEFAIGSGVNGLTYIVRRGNSLYEAPLSYYSRSAKWDLSPGYDQEDAGFTRPIAAGCSACHSGQPQPVPNQTGVYKDPPFRELAIGCENCHGPGQLHAAERGARSRLRGKIDLSIVNPSRLPAWLADNICMNCHQGGAIRVLQPGRQYGDFRPGTPLNEAVAIFSPPLKRDSPPTSPLLEHQSLMTLSKCFRASQGKLSCLSCHNPHDEPILDRAAYFRQKCLQCHGTRDCPVSRAAAGAQADCASCHMIKRDAGRIAHSVLTDHRIVKRESQPLPEEAFHRTSAEIPDMVHLNRIPGAPDSVPPLTLFRAYAAMLAGDTSYQPSYLAALEAARHTDRDDWQVLSGLARKALQSSNPESRTRAMEYLMRSVERGSHIDTDYDLLGSLLTQAGRTEEAITVLKRGIEVDPYYARFYKALTLLYISQKRFDEARETMRRAVEVIPQDSFMRSLLAKVDSPSQPAGR